MKKNDISSRSDIILLVDHFYDLVKKDPILGPLFQDVYQINWEKHLSNMYDFWENVLFFTGNYNGNPMYVHQNLHHIHLLTSKDFELWIRLFIHSIDQLFEGSQAEGLKLQAINIAIIIQDKLILPGDKNLPHS